MTYDFRYDKTVDYFTAKSIGQDLIKVIYPNAIMVETIAEGKVTVNERGELENVAYVTVKAISNSYAPEEITVDILINND